MRRISAPCTVWLVVGVGCVGEIDRAPSPGGEPTPAGSTAPEAPAIPAIGAPNAPPARAACRPTLAAPTLRRLTPDQLANAVKDLLGVEAADDGLLAVRVSRGYRTNVNLNVMTADLVVELGQSVAVLAGRATRDVPKLLGCTPEGTGENACVTGFVRTLTRRAYRRPPSDTEAQTLVRLYFDLRKGGASSADAVAAVVEAVLQSPQFLYVREAGMPEARPGEPAPLTDDEVAARLALLLWDALPDAELQRTADAGGLRSATEVATEARRLLRDPRAARALSRFVQDWLELFRLHDTTKDAKVFPEWNDSLRAAMFHEVDTFLGEIVGKGDGRLSTMLTARFSVANAALAPLYLRVELPPERGGLLTQVGFLAAHAGPGESSPIARGAFVRRNALCTAIEIPPNVDVEEPPVDPVVGVRERLAAHRQSPACASCHALMDPIGFGLEGYDAIGRHRTMDHAKRPIDVSGELTAAGDATGFFSGGVELGRKLAASTTVRDCFTAQLLEHALARALEPTDACAHAALARRFGEAGGDVRELLVALVSSDGFRFLRSP